MRNWIPGAKVIRAYKDSTLQGGPKKVVWHTTENDPNKTSATAIANYLNRIGAQVHVVWNPVTGEIVQMIPANRGGRGLVNRSGGVETNRGGSIVFQIEVVGQAVHPWTDGPCVGLGKISNFLKDLGVPEVWPAGDLEPYPESYGGYRSTSDWNKSGHFGHSQVPENDHGDPGNLNQAKVFTGTDTGSPGSNVGGGGGSRKLTVDGKAGPNTMTALADVLGVLPYHGKVYNQSYWIKEHNPGLAARGNWYFNNSGDGDGKIRALQRYLKKRGAYNGKVDGLAGPNFWTSVQKWLHTEPDGVVSDPSEVIRALQRWINRYI